MNTTITQTGNNTQQNTINSLNFINKTEVFERELLTIKDDEIRRFAKEAIKQLPDYFFYLPASSTGKYHPKTSQGVGGLVRHTKATIAFAKEMQNLELYGFTDEEKDLMIVSLLLHDGFKYGLPEKQSKDTVKEHPIIVHNWLQSNETLKTMLSDDQVNFILSCVVTHMGEWNKAYRSKKEILPKPVTKCQMFIHLCDYLASRKNIAIDVE